MGHRTHPPPALSMLSSYGGTRPGSFIGITFPASSASRICRLLFLLHSSWQSCHVGSSGVTILTTSLSTPLTSSQRSICLKLLPVYKTSQETTYSRLLLIRKLYEPLCMAPATVESRGGAALDTFVTSIFI